jgi:hypothetical protein
MHTLRDLVVSKIYNSRSLICLESHIATHRLIFNTNSATSAFLDEPPEFVHMVYTDVFQLRLGIVKEA